MTLDPVIAWSLRLALSALLLAAAWHKLSDSRRFATTIRAHSLLPPMAVPVFARMLPFAEIALGLMLLRPGAGTYSVIATASLLTLYTVALVVNLARGRTHIDCGCFASSEEVPIGPGIVARNVGLVAAVLTLLLPGRARTLVWIDWVSLGATLVTLGLLWMATQRMAHTGPALRRLGGAR